MKKINRTDIIIMGDMNAKVGPENEGLEQIMGRHTLGKINEKGELVTEFCASYDLVIGSTVFPHKK
jgi:hypothetical protein